MLDIGTKVKLLDKGSRFCGQEGHVESKTVQGNYVVKLDSGYMLFVLKNDLEKI